jgi:hypothetical protein
LRLRLKIKPGKIFKHQLTSLNQAGRKSYPHYGAGSQGPKKRAGRK